MQEVLRWCEYIAHLYVGLTMHHGRFTLSFTAIRPFMTGIQQGFLLVRNVNLWRWKLLVFRKKDLYLIITQKLINLQVLADCPLRLERPRNG